MHTPEAVWTRLTQFLCVTAYVRLLPPSTPITTAKLPGSRDALDCSAVVGPREYAIAGPASFQNRRVTIELKILFCLVPKPHIVGVNLGTRLRHFIQCSRSGVEEPGNEAMPQMRGFHYKMIWSPPPHAHRRTSRYEVKSFFLFSEFKEVIVVNTGSVFVK